jgi:hypothetical protein
MSKWQWLGIGGLGVVVLVPFSQWWTILIGVGLLIAFVVLGVLRIASPAFLEQDDD